MHVLFWLAMAWILYVYVGYPIILALLGTFRAIDTHRRGDYVPHVSVLISARNEEKDIGWKIRETLAWDYPADRLQILVASDASEDRTDDIIRGFIDPRLTFVRLEQRAGKNAALNQLATMARGEVLFFTDANTSITPHCLRSMVQHFADSRVGCVTGWEGHATVNEESLSVGGLASLGYESAINALESQLGSVLICDGSIFCIRRSLYRRVDPDLANDLELPLWIGSQGYRLLYEPKARSAEQATSSPREEFQRRRRICAQGILGMWKLRGLLRGMRAWQFMTRKFLRWLTLIPLVIILGTTAALSSRWSFQILLVLQTTFYILGLAGWLAASRGQKSRRVTSIPFYFLLLNTAALIGVAEACSGRRFSVWDVASLTRGHEQSRKTWIPRKV